MENETPNQVEPISAEEAIFLALQGILIALRGHPIIGPLLAESLTCLEITNCHSGLLSGRGGAIIRVLQAIASTGRGRDAYPTVGSEGGGDARNNSLDRFSELMHMTTLGRTALYELIKLGELKPVKLGRKTVFLQGEVVAWISARLASRN